MKPLTTRAMMLGHPLAVAPAFGFFLWSGYVWLMEPQAWPMAALALGILAPVMRAHEQRHLYRTWKRAWDGMANSSPRRRRNLKPLTVAIMLIAAGLYMVATLDRIDTQTGVDLMIAVVIAAMGFGIFRGLRRLARWAKTGRAKSDLVTILSRRPSLKVPTLKQAYVALPTHCWQVLGGR